MLLFLLFVVAIAAAYTYLIKPFSYWKRKGIPQTNPYPPLGDTTAAFLWRESFLELMTRLYNEAGERRYYGYYQTVSPLLLIKDLDLLKQITVKDFDHFQDHKNFIPEDIDPIWARVLFSLTGQKWREMRTTLSPSFTSSKMKSMFTFMSECSEKFVDYFCGMKEDIITIELKDSFTRYTNDVIASVAFGIKCDSLANKNNEFYRMGGQLNFNSTVQTMKFFIYMALPALGKLLRIPLFSREVTSFFRTLVKDTIALREKEGIVRPDMLHLLMEARKNGLKYEDEKSAIDAGFATVEESDIGKLKTEKHFEMTDEDIAAQALGFFFGGFDSTSNLMCFVGYELCANPDVQDKLRDEILTTLAECDAKVTYETLLKMKYLDMVISETLRKWPVVVVIDRVVTKPYTIKPANLDEDEVHLAVGDQMAIPIYNLQRDERYFPNPDAFDPERFNDENKKNINPYSFLPFGVGPRNCIGSRFALLETKILFFHILAKFDIVPVEKTQIPIKLSRMAGNPTAEGGFWFGLRRRK